MAKFLIVTLVMVFIRLSVSPDCSPDRSTLCTVDETLCYVFETGSHCKVLRDVAIAECEAIANSVAGASQGSLVYMKENTTHEYLKNSAMYNDEEFWISMEAVSGSNPVVYEWLDGDPITWEIWKHDEPKTEKSYVIVKYENSISDYAWKTKATDDDKHFICQYATNKCPAGSEGNPCSPCEKGSYKEAEGPEDCTACTGSRTTEGTGSSAASACVCAAGRTGSSCDPCDKGKYKTGTGSGSCTDCGSLKTTDSTGSTLASQCVCRKGYGGASCEICDYGSYKSVTGPSACVSCGEGKNTTAQGSEEATNCLCEKGYEGNSCTACVEGEYKDTTGSGSCTSCGAGKTTANPAATDVSECVCSPGRTGSSCSACLKGTYKTDRGTGACLQCATGRTTEGTGAQAIAECVCDLGYEGASCTPCSTGSYKDTTGPASCTVCQAPQTTTDEGAKDQSECVTPGTTCTISTYITGGHYKTPAKTVVAIGESLTLECEEGWTYEDGTTSKTFDCTAANIWGPPVPEQCIINLQCTAIPSTQRVDCGWPAITRELCEENLCCFDANSPTTQCYYNAKQSDVTLANDRTCTFHGKKYSVLASSAAGTPCPKDYPKLAQPGYIAEFHLLRTCISLLETTEGMASDVYRIDGSTTGSGPVSDLDLYQPQSGSGSTCVAMATIKQDGSDATETVNMLQKSCSESAQPICYKHLDEINILRTEPSDDGNCRRFSAGNHSDILFWQTFTATDPTAKGYSLFSYKLTGVSHCKDMNILLSTNEGNGSVCQKTTPCQYLEEMPNQEACYRSCACDNGHCQGVVVIGPMTNAAGLEICQVQLA